MRPGCFRATGHLLLRVGGLPGPLLSSPWSAAMQGEGTSAGQVPGRRCSLFFNYCCERANRWDVSSGSADAGLGLKREELSSAAVLKHPSPHDVVPSCCRHRRAADRPVGEPDRLGSSRRPVRYGSAVVYRPGKRGRTDCAELIGNVGSRSSEWTRVTRKSNNS